MDRNKNRTDLLAAGRKRLQQFRQKKDNKGGSSHGKSSKKAGKPQLADADADADAASSASISTVTSLITDGNVEADSHSNVVNTETLESQSMVNSLAPDNMDPSVDSSSVVATSDTGDETVLDSNVELAHQVHGVCEKDNELSAQVQGKIAQDIGADVLGDVSLRTSDSLVTEGGETHDHASAPVAILSPPASVTIAVGESVSVREGEKREELLLISEDSPNTSVMQTREDQVTDLGAMQEADGLVIKKFCQSTEAVIDGQRELPLSEVGEIDQSLSGISLEKNTIEETSHEAEQLGKTIELLSSHKDILSEDKLSGFDKGQGDDIAAAGTLVRNLEREALPGSYHEEIPLQFNQEQNSKVVLCDQDGGLQEGFNQQCPHVGLAIEDPKSRGAHKFDPARPLDVSSVFDANSVNLLQLAEIIRGLNEEECQFLIEARAESNLDPLASGSILSEHDISQAFQSLKEELFLANLMKNIFNTQLAELLESDNRGDQLVDEISQLRASHNEVNEKNQHLSEELDNCRVELHHISSKNVELQNQFNAAMAEVEALSARVVELQNGFDMSQKVSLELSTELADCRGLISSLQVEKKGMNETLDLMIAEKNKLVEEKEFHLCESKNLATELADLKSSMEGVKLEKSNLIDKVSSVTEERNKIEGEIEHLKHEIDRLSLDLVENKDLVASLLAENSNLEGNLAFSADKIKNLEDDNQRLSSQFIALNEQLSTEKGDRMRFEGDLKEATARLEQISKENVFLSNSLGKNKAKIEDTGKEHSQPLSQPGDLGNQANIVVDQSKGVEIAITEDSLHMDEKPDEGASVGPHVNIVEHEIFDDSLGFVSLKDCLDEAENVLTKFEKAVNELHSQSVSSSWSGEKVSSPAVSKLIQAFESKVHEDEHEGETRDPGDVQSSSKSFIKLTKEQIENLKKLLSKWKLDVQIAGALFKGEREDRKTGDAKYSDLKDQFEQLKQHCSDLESSNIELAVQYETAKQHLGDIQEKKFLLEELCDALKQEDARLKAKNNELYEKLGYCQSKISELHTEVNDVKQISNDMASSVGNQLENLQKEVTERAMLLELGWNMTMAQIFELVGKLKESVGGTLNTTVSSDSHGNLDVSHQLEVSVHAAAEMIFDLQKKLEGTYSEHEIMCASYKEMNSKCDDLLGRNELAFSLLHKMYSDLRKLVLCNGETTDDDMIDLQSVALPDLLNYNSYEPILKHIGNILTEKLELESVTKEMKSELMHRETELEELKMKCLDLDSVSKLIEDLAGILNADISKLDMNKSPLSCLDSLVSSLVQKTKEAEIQYHTTKEGYGSKEMELAELKEKMHNLDTLRLENENEILVLKESLYQAEEALAVARSELQKKSNELEHSEQRVSSIREKLSIAVAKGKGLVVQRDGLKQSLAETSSELERCLQELQLKDTRLHEAETKLKTYAEAGERVEALESELSYIRNSSNALRESFLLKDSMLQRIEEILEDLDLPEQFHSRDTIEKIDWLASSVSGNSLPMNDWEQKDAVGGGSYSDAGYVATDSWKDDSQLQPDSDDFRKRFEELQSKYYGLAEQNEMLEQSLMERNILVQRWEELVNRVEMPSHLQSMETEHKIECICAALTEANHHIDALQLKIEKYDNYCGFLNTDLEESQRTASALQEDLSTLKSERGSLSEKMESLLHEYDKLSLQTSEAELENEKLHKEITSLKDILEHKTAIEEQIFTIDGKIRKLQDLVGDALSEFETQNTVFDSANIDSLEELVGKLVEKLNMERKLSALARETELQNEKLHDEIANLKDQLEQKATLEEQTFTIHGKIRKLHDLVGDALSESETQNMVFGGANIDSLEELVGKLVEKVNMERELSSLTRETELENEKLHNEIANLKHKLEQKAALEEQILTIDSKIRKLHDLVGDALSESETENLVFGGANIDSLEELVGKLVEKVNMERKLSALTRETELENEKLHNEIANLKHKLEQKAALEEQILTIDNKIRKLHDLVGDALSESETENLVSDSSNIDLLEELLRKLIENHANLSSRNPGYGVVDDGTLHEERSIDVHDKETDIDRYKIDLEKSLNELMLVKEERDRSLEKQISLSGEVEAMTKRIEELQGLLNQEEQKSASVREKLNIAVRKGKSLVQQRDSLKQTIEEMTVEMEHLKSEITNWENTLAEREQKLRQLSTYPDRLEALESESLLLKKHLEETEHHLQEQEYSLKLILNKLGQIEFGGEGHISDPVEKLEWVGKLCSDLHNTVASLEQESRKSKRASELLLAELNEVQERNDSFQEELAKVTAELVDSRRERDSAEASKLEALARLEKLSALHEEGKKSHFSNIMELKSSLNLGRKSFGEVHNLLCNAFSFDLESYQKLEAGLESCMKGNNATNMVDSSVTKEHWASSTKKISVPSDPWADFDTIDQYDDNTSVENVRLFGHQLQEFMLKISSLKETINMHSSLAQEQDKALSKLMASIQREMTSQKVLSETMRKEVSERDEKLVALRENITCLYEACNNFAIVLENEKAELSGKKVESSDLGINLKTPSFDDDISGESIKTMTDRLLLAVKGFTSIRTEFLDSNQKEMKATIANLQRELQEKDVQRDKICSDLVKQIKDAEAAANSYSQDLQAFRIQEHNLKKEVEAIEAERKILEQRVNELQDRQETAAELEAKMRSQTGLLAAKDQEIEALMHALDEEETQMEELTNKIVDLEKVVQQKNQEIENLESSRGKAIKKLLVTVSKFDELHHLSASLLSEVEKLQSQLQERDTEISFLRQEVTRCTNDVLLASQMSNQSSDEIFEFLMWVDMVVSHDGVHDIHPDMKNNSHECKEILHKKLTLLLSEMENLREVVESKDVMLQVERSKVEELNHKTETLEMSLHEKELQLNMLEGVEETGKGAGTSSEIVEVEPVMNHWSPSGAFVAPQVRSLRKGNSDHITIAVDADPGSTSRIEDEEDDKVHGFKSLTSSRIVPKFTRPLTDLVDGLWVSCDRTLMRQPVLRLGIIFYWAIMHALLAFFVV